MGLFPQQFIDDLRLQANIVQVMQEYVPLKRAGTTYKGLCPFHSEKSPSFNVNPDKGFFHCFGCGVGGDVFKFLELHEKVGFQDAVRMLAQKFGDRDSRSGRRRRRGCAARFSAAGIAAQDSRSRRPRTSASSSAAPAGARARQQLKDRGSQPENDRAARRSATRLRRGTD